MHPKRSTAKEMRTPACFPTTARLARPSYRSAKRAVPVSRIARVSLVSVQLRRRHRCAAFARAPHPSTRRHFAPRTPAEGRPPRCCPETARERARRSSPLRQPSGVPRYLSNDARTLRADAPRAFGPTFSIARSFEATLARHRPAPVTGTVAALYSSPRWVFLAPDPRNRSLFLPTNLFHQICRQCRVRQSRREEVWRLLRASVAHVCCVSSRPRTAVPCCRIRHHLR